ncbi:MAG: diadenylate cyclase [Syntrophales bacterium]
MHILNWIKEIGISGSLDILLMALLIYSILVWLKQTRAAFVLTGIIIVSFAYLLMRQLGMVMISKVFEQFFAVILIALVIIFQEEIKQFFEKVAILSLQGKFRRAKAAFLSRQEVTLLVKTLMDLAKERIGALIVISGKDLIRRYLNSGQNLDAILSEPLLKSIFDPHSMGHDGAVIIRDDRVSQFSAHLPLSKNLNKLSGRGTRHAAALGLSEIADALCIVVSEERGTISVARYGNIEEISNPEMLAVVLENFYREIHPVQGVGYWQNFYLKNWREKVIAAGIALALWFVLVQGFKLTYKTFTVPVTYFEVNPSLAVEDINPEEINVTLRGRRNDFYFMSKNQIKLFVRLDKKAGRQRIDITPTNLIFPNDLALEKIFPEQIDVRVRKIAGVNEPKKN